MAMGDFKMREEEIKIGIICNGFINSGGMERYTLDLVREALRRGIKPIVFTSKIDKSLPEYKKVEVIKIKPWFILPTERFMDR